MRIVVFVLLLINVLPSGAQTKDISGLWEGKLNLGFELTVVFNFTKNSDGSFKATMDSPDDAYDESIPCNTVTISGDSVSTEISIAQAVFKAVVINDSTMSGVFEQAGVPIPLVLKHVEKVTSVARPQTPHLPFDYNSEDVMYYNSDSSLHFGATLTYPKSGSPFATAILITGSGQQDRDETIFGHKPFAVIADYLTKNGYAVLRVDDRGVGKTSFGDATNATSADFAKDVEAGLAYLNTRKEVNKSKIGLIGHSEGGLIASIVGSKNKDVSFIIMLAGPGTDGATLLADQNEAMFASSGVSKEVAAADKLLYRKIIRNSLEKDTAIAIAKSMDEYREWKKTTNPRIVDTLAMNEAEALKGIRQTIKQFSIPWFRFFIETNPADYISKLQCKVLALNGSKDLQVLPKQNLSAIKKALQKTKSKAYDTIELPGLNHLFQHCNTCTTQEYGQLEETFAPAALEVMLKWLNKNIGSQ